MFDLWFNIQKSLKIVAFRTEDLFGSEITTKLAENGGFLNWRTFFVVFFVCEDRSQREDFSPKFLLASPKKFRSGHVPSS